MFLIPAKLREFRQTAAQSYPLEGRERPIDVRHLPIETHGAQ